MEPLCDPVNDRMVKNITPPPHRPLSKALIYPAALKGKLLDSGKPDWKQIRDHLQKEGRILKEDVIAITQEAMKIMSFIR